MKRRKNKQHITEPHELPDAATAAPAEVVEPAPEPEAPKGRQLVVVDVETTGLGDDVAVLEVAAVNVDTGEELSFVPHVDWSVFNNADRAALDINRYFDRGLWRDMLDAKRTGDAYAKLRKMLHGNTFAGSNPTFDSNLIAAQTFRRRMPVYSFYDPSWPPSDRSHYMAIGRVWHHRLGDLATYAAGKLDIDPTELPGLEAVCDALGVMPAPEGRHTALGDARAAAECFDILRRMSAMRTAVTFAFDEAPRLTFPAIVPAGDVR